LTGGGRQRSRWDRLLFHVVVIAVIISQTPMPMPVVVALPDWSFVATCAARAAPKPVCQYEGARKRSVVPIQRPANATGRTDTG
jgi:hypothetical protein